MDPVRFDALARTLATRRAAARLTLLGAGLGLGLAGRPPAPAPAPAAAGGNAFGCTKQRSACAVPVVDDRCPDLGTGVCATVKGKARCFESIHCHDCKANADCADFGAGSKCVRKCANCHPNGTDSACVSPLLG